MLNGVRLRIALWASAGFLVASSWARYFAIADKDNPIEPMVSILARVTQPVTALGSYFHFPIGVRSALLANATTYALVGLIVETIRRHYHPHGGRYVE